MRVVQILTANCSLGCSTLRGREGNRPAQTQVSRILLDTHCELCAIFVCKVYMFAQGRHHVQSAVMNCFYEGDHSLEGALPYSSCRRSRCISGSKEPPYIHRSASVSRVWFGAVVHGLLPYSNRSHHLLGSVLSPNALPILDGAMAANSRSGMCLRRICRTR